MSFPPEKDEQLTEGISHLVTSSDEAKVNEGRDSDAKDGVVPENG